MLKDLGIEYVKSSYRSGLWGHPFQVVTLNYVLEHALDPGAMLREVVRDLDRNGALVCIEVPDGIAFEKVDPDDDIFNSCHLWLFEPMSMTLLLNACGLEVMSLSRRKQIRGHYSLHIICRPYRVD